jgi:hypothetical protein
VQSEQWRRAVSWVTARPFISRTPDEGDPSSRSALNLLTSLDIWSFMVPAMSFFAITLGGQLIVSELLMLVMLPWLWRVRDRLPLPRWFVVLWAGWLLSQVATDLVRGSAFHDFARGWAAIAFTLVDFAAILVLVSTPRRARLFALGLAAGGILGYLFAPIAYAAGDPWKFAFALPVGFALAAGLSGSAGARRPWLPIAAFTLFGVLNLGFGFRSLGGVSLLTAGYSVLGGVAQRQRWSPDHSMLRAVAALAILAVVAISVLQIYDVAASKGLLGSAAQAKYAAQSGDTGVFGVFLGGRSEILVSTQAILDSPILGHGSWAKDIHYVDLLAQRLSSLGYDPAAAYAEGDLIPAHSYFTGSWIWAGFLGGLFWLGVFWIAVRLLANLYSFRMELAPLLAFSTVLLLWNLAFSPYGSSARILACYGLALCLVGLRHMRRDTVEHPLDSGARLPSRPGQAASDTSGEGGSPATDGLSDPALVRGQP